MTGVQTCALPISCSWNSLRSPASDADYAGLRKEFQEQGALEVLLQTCNFSFMNRFTDGLHLPSEDEAITIYKSVYGREGLKPRS